jgi:hypothetical protein
MVHGQAQRQRREHKVLAYLEPIVHAAMTRLVEQHGISYSEYIHKLVVNDLKDRGLLTEKMITETLV